MTIFHQNGLWQSKLYDKRVDLQRTGLKVNRFPDQRSKLTDRCKYGVITSQLHRYAVACTRSSDFIKAATELYSTFIKKQYNRQSINKYFGRFMRRSMPHLKTGVIQQAHAYKRNIHQQGTASSTVASPSEAVGVCVGPLSYHSPTSPQCTAQPD